MTDLVPRRTACVGPPRHGARPAQSRALARDARRVVFAVRGILIDAAEIAPATCPVSERRLRPHRVPRLIAP